MGDVEWEDKTTRHRIFPDRDACDRRNRCARCRRASMSGTARRQSVCLVRPVRRAPAAELAPRAPGPPCSNAADHAGPATCRSRSLQAAAVPLSPRRSSVSDSWRHLEVSSSLEAGAAATASTASPLNSGRNEEKAKPHLIMT